LGKEGNNLMPTSPGCKYLIPSHFWLSSCIFNQLRMFSCACCHLA